MSDLKRLEVKYVRDRAKSRYKRGSECEICGTTDELQFHHFYTVDLLWNRWKKLKGIVINCVDDIMEVRDAFIEDHERELYEETATLCKHCHNNRLHRVYGQKPSLATAEKQKRWLLKQRDKFYGSN